MFVFTEQKKGNIVRSSGEEVMANLQSLLDVEESINVSSSCYTCPIVALGHDPKPNFRLMILKTTWKRFEPRLSPKVKQKMNFGIRQTQLPT